MVLDNDRPVRTQGGVMAHGGKRARRAFVGALVAAAALLTPTQVVGAQEGGGPSKPAIFNNGNWYLRNSLTTGPADSTFRYGTASDIPVMGDWDGDGDDTVGIVRFTQVPGGFQYTWHLRNENSAGSATVPPFVFGNVQFVAVDQLGTLPVVGDWDGDGDDTPGLMQYSQSTTGPMTWLLRNSSSAGPADIVTSYSKGRDRPVTGDWDGDGDDTIGVVRGDTWLLSNSTSGGNANVQFTFGSAAYPELPVPGDWDGNGTYTPAILRNKPPTDVEGGYEHWLFRNALSGGTADGQFTYGGDSLPIFAPIEVMDRLSWR
jgi:hypothetical protein